jgi:predicted phosphodiesterase
MKNKDRPRREFHKDRTHLHKIHHRIEQYPIRFGVVSDTHLASDYEDLESLEKMYNIFSKEGINKVFHSGDITDGIGVYSGQENFLKVTGVAKQAKYVIENYPKKKGIETILISGNHDMKAFKSSGADVCSLITHGGFVEENTEVLELEGRKDIKYIGRYYGRVRWNDINIDLVHPDYGFAYAISYPIQKYINELEGGSKPDILLFGHLHRSIFMNYRNINVLMAGCFQVQNDYLKRKGIMPVRGGWIVEFEKDREINPRFFQFMK